MTKQEIRKLANAQRHALTIEQRKAYSEQLCELLKTLPELQEAKVIFSYKNMDDEIDLSNFDAWAVEQGKTVLYPVCLKDGIMDAYEPSTGEDAWEVDKYGIASPVVAKSKLYQPEQVDAIMVPCVAFDEHLGRSGHGAGYYDRYMPKTDAKRILIAFEAQKVPQCVMDEYDLWVDCCVTEAKVYRN